MPVYKALILNKEININYEHDEKEKLEEAVNAINIKLKKYETLNSKISDSKLLSFLAIKLQAEILEFKEIKKNQIDNEKILNQNKNHNIKLTDDLQKLSSQNNLLEKQSELINEDLIELNKQISQIIDLLKKL